MNEILYNHKLALCDDQSADMVLLQTAAQPARLTLLYAQDGQNNDNCKHPMYNNIILVNLTTECSHHNQDLYSRNQSTVILQFSIIIQELWNFMGKGSGDLNKIA